MTFNYAATETANVLRSPAMASGKVGVPAAHLSDVPILPLMPITPEILELYKLSSPREKYVTYVNNAVDIQEGDVLVVDSLQFLVKAVGPWLEPRPYIEVVIELVVGT